MSMNLYVKSAAELELRRFERNPGLIENLADGAALSGLGGLPAGFPNADEVLRSLDRHRPASFRERIFMFFMKRKMRRDLAKLSARMASARSSGPTGTSEVLDLHKSWHMLHYVFTGSAWEGAAPANTLLLGGREVGEDMGYGPARIVSVAETSAFDAFLKGQTPEALERRIDISRMSSLGIYCAEGGEDADAAELVDDLGHYLPMLKSYVAEAADKRNGLVIWMS